MKNLLSKPYFLYWFSLPFIFLIFSPRMNTAIDIQLHSAYVVFGYWDIANLMGMLIGLIGFLYFFLERKDKLTEGKLPRTTVINLIFTLVLAFIVVQIGFTKHAFIHVQIGNSTLMGPWPNWIVIISFLLWFSVQIISIIRLLIQLLSNKNLN